jgi:hypothetical protein
VVLSTQKGLSNSEFRWFGGGSDGTWRAAFGIAQPRLMLFNPHLRRDSAVLAKPDPTLVRIAAIERPGLRKQQAAAIPSGSVP